MKIYTITEAAYLNEDGDWPGDCLEALNGTARSFRRRDCAIQEVRDWIRDTIDEFYAEREEDDADDTYRIVMEREEHVKDSECCPMKNRCVWELQLCGRIYKWSMFEQEI